MPQLRWLLDVGLPRPSGKTVDVVHAQDIERIPGVAGIREARALDRVLVTCNRDFCGPWSVPVDHPGIVVLATKPVDGNEVERELGHIEFRLQQYGDLASCKDCRFFLKPDGYLARISETGREEPLAPWKNLWIQGALPSSKEFVSSVMPR